MDLGATNVQIAIYDENMTEIVSSFIELKDKGYIAVIKLVTDTIMGYLGDEIPWESIRGGGFGAPGRSKNGMLISAANYPLWENVPLCQDIYNRTKIHVRIVKRYVYVL